MTGGLDESDVDEDPVRQFQAWYADAGTDAMALVTASAEGDPAGRMVLLKGADDRGFAFVTNQTSAKAAHLAANPRAALIFYWPPDRQVRVTGSVGMMDRDESEAYWRTRPRASQLGAWASQQSQVIDGRTELERRLAEATARFPAEVPCPPFWGGYRLVPTEIEFWHHRDDRLHDRLRYRRTADDWVMERLSP